MRKLKYFLISALSVMAISSCESVYDFGSDGSLDYDTIFSDRMEAGYYLSTCYNSIQGFASGSAGGNFLAVFTDEAQDARDVVGCNAMSYYMGNMNKNNNLVDNIYSSMFTGIRSCNVFLANIDKVTNFEGEAGAEEREMWRAEAYTLRAYYYLQLIKRYGPMPILDEVLPLDYDYSKITRPTFYENVQSIMDDCDAALAIKSFPMRVDSDGRVGAVTASVAYAIKSQAILYAASPLWCDGQNHWAEAAKVTKEAMDKLEEAGYKLYSNKTAVVGSFGAYQNYFLSDPEYVAAPKNDTESIYTNKGRMTLWKTFGIPSIADVTDTKLSPSQELVDAYETIDGEPILDLEEPYIGGDHLKPNYNPAANYDPKNPYANRDPRLGASIYTNNSFYDLNTKKVRVETFVGGNSEVSTSNQRYTRTGYYLRKWVHYTSKSTINKDGYWRQMRMAEIYLNYAEAEFYANGATPEAIEAINQTRTRAGIPALKSGISADEFELRLRNERRVEFAFEEHRYYDLRRWNIAAEHEGEITGMRIEKKADGSFEYNRFSLGERNVTDSKYNMLPIPISEEQIFNDKGVKFQNPGW